MTDPATYIEGRTVQEQMNSLIGYVDERSAEVALDAIAADVAQVAADKADAHADALAAAASAAAAAGTLANAVKKTGESSQSIAGDIAVAGALSGGSISTSGAATFSGTTTVPTPTNNTDAATKKYVDDADALKISITDINNYAVGLTGKQNVAGVKRIGNSFFYSQQISGINSVEICRYPIVPSSRTFINLFTRYGSCVMDLEVTTDGSSTVTNITAAKAVVKSTTIMASAIFGYVDNGYVVLCVGNAINANNYFTVDVKGIQNNNNGAVINPDITNCGTSRDTSGAVSLVVFQ